MPPSLLSLAAHVPLLVAALMAVGLGVLLIGLNNLLGPRRISPVKQEAFECGNPPSGSARERFAVKFYLVAILFLIFDIEAVFIYPWALVFSDAVKGASALSPMLILIDMLVFVAIIVVGLAYAWRKGALEWGPKSHTLGETE
ncbi:MAG: NADH-quinone oxidoreductase subunit A [Deltaproteobacteria bacterium]|nr:NADH-quinone oxidoreductase subunit A [Deltaproteobacteria bacterium]